MGENMTRESLKMLLEYAEKRLIRIESEIDSNPNLARRMCDELRENLANPNPDFLTYIDIDLGR